MRVKKKRTDVPRTQHARSEATRAELVAAAAKLFGERGFAATQVEDVVRAIGATRGALYHHFESKRAVFRTVFEAEETRLVAVVSAAAARRSGALAALRAGCHAFLEAFTDRALQRILLLDGPAVLGWETWREIDDRYGHDLLRRALDAAFDEAGFRARDSDVTAHLLLALLNEAALLIAAAAEPAVELPRVRREVDAWLEARIAAPGPIARGSSRR